MQKVTCRCISGRMHETIEHVLEADGGPMVIRDLTSCTLCIRGRVEALRMHGLKDCKVIAGPVHGSAFVEGHNSPWLPAEVLAGAVMH